MYENPQTVTVTLHIS